MLGAYKLPRYVHKTDVEQMKYPNIYWPSISTVYTKRSYYEFLMKIK